MYSLGRRAHRRHWDPRKPEIYFSRDWEAHSTRHKQIITWLLRHDLAKHPSALDLSQNAVLPPRMEHECFQGALRMMVSTRQSIPGPLYDLAKALEHAQLSNMVEERLSAIFYLHGAASNRLRRGPQTRRSNQIRCYGIHRRRTTIVGAPSLENWCTLTKLHAFTLEALRWRPVNPLGVPHRAARGVIWPLTSIPSRCVPRDPEVLPDPETFDINRWVNQDENFNDIKAYSFGFGRRI
ncbi:hypothetical protein BU15DRAFT_58977 [Melanogaster broomeanus]|nr:hypothetical protein BU15DRAFT_58977 [Melanogaster broomeanus]